jgi:hypothetical protein
MKNAPTPEACDAKTLAVIAAQFIARGVDEQEALQKANALYLKATAYAKKFASLSPSEKEFEAFPDEATRALGESGDLAIGDSEANSPALKYFRETAKTKRDQNITYKKFVEIVRRHFSQRVEEIRPSGEKIEKIEPPISLRLSQVEHLLGLLRDQRKRSKAAWRKKSVENNRTKRGL